MDSRYLYRGICTQKSRDFEGKWVYGDHVIIGGRHYIHPQANNTDVSEAGIAKLLIMHPVDPATVGQCTGLRDKNGTLIYEGDIVELGMSKDTVRCDIQYRDGSFCAVSFRYDDEYYLSDSHNDVEIIGNIHDNPELMEVQP